MDFFVWRGCDISGSSASRAIADSMDVLTRAGALLDSDSGLPPDTGVPPDAPAPSLCILSAEWRPGIVSGGLLQPGSYKYKVIPLDTCTGRTGVPIDLPDLIINKIGEQSTLLLTLCETPNACTGIMLQRDGLLIGPVLPVIPQASYPVTVELNVDGIYEDGTSQSFNKTSGSADLIGRALRGSHAFIFPPVREGYLVVQGLFGIEPEFEGAILTLSKTGTPSNSGTYIIEKRVTSTEVEIRNTSPLSVAPDANNGAIEWALAPDAIELEVTNGDRPGKSIVTVERVDGSVVTFAPPLTASTELRPYSYMDVAQRTGIFATNIPAGPLVLVPTAFPFNLITPVIPFVGPYFAFNSLPTPTGFGFSASITDYVDGELTIEGLTGITASNLGQCLSILSVSNTPITGNTASLTVGSYGAVTVTDPAGIPIGSAVGSTCKITNANDGLLNGSFTITEIVSATEIKICNLAAIAIPSGTLDGNNGSINWSIALKSTSGVFTITKVISTTSVKVNFFVPPLSPPPPVPDPNNGSILWMSVGVSIPQAGDVITWRDKTALVIHVHTPEEPFSGYPFGFPVVAVIPFNLVNLPIPLGLFQLVYRPQSPITIGQYYINTTLSPVSTLPATDKSLKVEVKGNGITPTPPTGLIGSTAVVSSTAPINALYAEVVITGLSGVTGEMAGLTCTLSGADSAANNGSFTILEVLGATSVKVRGNAAAVAPDVNNGLISWQINNVGAPDDENLVIGRPIVIDARICSIVAVYNATKLDTTLDYGYAVIEVNPFDPATLNNPLPGTSDMSIGCYITLPDELSAFIDRSGIPSVGKYKRVTRTSKVTTASQSWQYVEAGQDQSRSGTIGDDVVLAYNELDQVFTQAGYPNGIRGLLDKLRGPSDSNVSLTFNNTLGNFTQLILGGFYYAVNGIVENENCEIIDLDGVRPIYELLCSSFDNVEAVLADIARDGFSIMKVEQRTSIVRPPSCPPDQPGTAVTEYVCVGTASLNQKLKPNQFCRVFWIDTVRASIGMKAKLMDLGLTSIEADAALVLKSMDRVLSSMDIDVSALNSLAALGDGVDDLLADTRITRISPCRVTRSQLDIAIGLRGTNGTPQRPIGTEADAPRVADFSPVTPALMDLVATKSLDFCDIEGALNSIVDENTRNAVAGVLALIESNIDKIVELAKMVKTFLDSKSYKEFSETLGAILTSIFADPTLSCFLGPNNANARGLGIPNLPNVEAMLLGFSGSYSLRFNLLQLFARGLESVICSSLNALLGLLPTSDAADIRRAIACLPPLPELNIALPGIPINFQITIECLIELMRTILGLVQALIAEINEIINFVNGLSSGFISRSAQARNNACSSSQDLLDAVKSAAAALGFPVSLLG